MNSLKKDLSEFYDRQFEREAVFQELLDERDRAIELAKERSMFAWFTGASLTSSFPMLYAAHRFKNRMLLLPIIPIFMINGYHYDKYFGDNLNTIKSSAENIMLREKHLLKQVGGTVTLHEIDKRVEQKRMTYEK
uniref:Plasminogen receptor (KT) n=1 Tax=Strongyloides venezuelensis TaxID=75913 RepID=A0A0K0FFB4_STRVS